jgi:hypothetical protein
MDPTKEQRQILYKSRKKCDGDPGNDIQAFGEEASAVHGKSKLSENEKGETGKEQSQEHAHHFPLTSRGLFPKNSSWQANSQFRMPL